jgi:hypothetical protein
LVSRVKNSRPCCKFNKHAVSAETAKAPINTKSKQQLIVAEVACAALQLLQTV